MLLAIMLAQATLPPLTNEVCYPRDNTARVLKSASPLDLHPHWSGLTIIGLDTRIRMREHRVFSDVEYIRGDVSTPGHPGVDRGAWVLAREWSCEVE